uniref:Uncharacterized protein n=1 Tax=Cacopsylla melanoneura TaxID=428564 RepID=A0A8D8RQG1_9HEMI
MILTLLVLHYREFGSCSMCEQFFFFFFYIFCMLGMLFYSLPISRSLESFPASCPWSIISSGSSMQTFTCPSVPDISRTASIYGDSCVCCMCRNHPYMEPPK